MFIGIGNNNRICQVGENIHDITATGLIVIEVDRNLFGSWTNRRILAYCYEPLDGNSYSIYPHMDLTSIIMEDNLEAAELANLQLSSDIVDITYNQCMEVINNV